MEQFNMNNVNMKTVSDHPKRKQKVHQLIRSIRKKYLSLKLNKAEDDSTIQRLFNPITTRLNDIQNMQLVNLKNTTPVPSKQPSISSSPISVSTKVVTPPALYEKPTIHQEFIKPPTILSKDEDVDSIDDESQYKPNIEPIKKNPISTKDFLKQFPEESRDYVLYTVFPKFQKKTDIVDRTYGPRYDHDLSQWYLGNTSIDFQKDNKIILGNKQYIGTKGLYELLFSKNPVKYTNTDLMNYGEILKLTSVHKRNYDAAKQVSGNGGYKYLSVIKPLLEKIEGKSGGDLMSYNEKPIEYVYWDDINELVERLRLLYASKSAGNNSVVNEIQSIVEELREAQVIY